jgi:putative redox protein
MQGSLSPHAAVQYAFVGEEIRGGDSKSRIQRQWCIGHNDRPAGSAFDHGMHHQLDAGTGMGFVAETGSGHLLTMDGAPDGGGRNLAPRPMETVLAGTGGCTAYDVVLILKRGRHDVRGCQVKLRPSAPAADPKVFTKHPHALRGHGRGAAAGGGGARHRAVARALLLGQHHAGKTAEITTSFEIVEAG